MFDIGWTELVVIGVVALLVVGPKELPALLRTIGRYMGMVKRQANELELKQRKLQLEFSRRTAPQRIDAQAQKQGFSLPSTHQTAAVRRGEKGNAE